MPALFFEKESTRLRVCSQINDKSFACNTTKDELPIDTFTNVQVSQVHINYQQFQYTVKIAGKEVYSVVNKQARSSFNVSVFVGGNPFQPAVAHVKNVVFHNLPYGKFFFKLDILLKTSCNTFNKCNFTNCRKY